MLTFDVCALPSIQITSAELFHRWISAGKSCLSMACVVFFVMAIVSVERTYGAKPHHHSNGASQAARAAALRSAENQAKAEIQGAKGALNAANAKGAVAASQLGAAQSKINDAKGDIDRLRTELDALEEQLRQIERDIEAQQPSDSKAMQAKRAWELKEEAHQDARKAVLESDAYKAAYAAAKESPDRLNEMSRAKREAFEKSAEYQSVKMAHDAAEEAWYSLRLTLYTADSTWKQTSDDLREARASLNQADAAIRGGGLHKMSAGADLREAQQAAAVASTFLQQAEARLKAVQSRLRSVNASRKRRY